MLLKILPITVKTKLNHFRQSVVNVIIILNIPLNKVSLKQKTRDFYGFWSRCIIFFGGVWTHGPFQDSNLLTIAQSSDTVGYSKREMGGGIEGGMERGIEGGIQGGNE
jgi:hypothetical protein